MAKRSFKKMMNQKLGGVDTHSTAAGFAPVFSK